MNGVVSDSKSDVRYAIDISDVQFVNQSDALANRIQQNNFNCINLLGSLTEAIII